ncbi:MAG: hypothetical protein ACOCVC_03155 [Spirochaeta sp.]
MISGDSSHAASHDPSHRRRPAVTPSIWLLLYLLTAFLPGCSADPETRISVLTSEPILFIYAEYYNAQQDSIYVDVQHTENPIAFLNQPGEPPDLVIQPNPAGTNSTSWFRKIDLELPDDIYPQIAATFEKETGSTMLPLAFSLPVIVWHDQSPGPNPPLTIGLTQLNELTTTERSGDRLTHTGFSPVWNPQLLPLILRARGINPSFTDQGTPEWNSEEIGDAVTEIRNWIDENFQNRDELELFNETYMYPPYYTLLRQERIDYYPVDLHDFLSLPSNLRSDLDFAWFGNNGRIPVTSSVIYAAIPRESKEHQAASDFLQWITSTENQASLITYTIEQELPEFGFFGGLSSLSSTNEKTIPNLFPELQGKAPVSSRLLFPPPMPAYWNSLEDEVIAPFLAESVMQETPLPNEVLHTRINRWLTRLGRN